MPNISEFIQAASSNYTRGRTRSVDYIVIHFTATSASAHNNLVYFSRGGAGASAHYFVDKDGTICQSVNESDTAWHAGNWTMNCRSIGIENVSAGEDFTEAQINSLAALVQSLMAKYGISSSHVIRHYDVTGKRCPAPYVDRAKWNALHARITGGAVTTTPSAPTSADIIPVHYALRLKNGGWLSEVTNFNNSNNDGFAGYPCKQHDLLYAKVDRGTLRYRAHTLEDGWLAWVSKGDPNDTVNGCAGVPGHTIDGVQFYYVTPDGEPFRQAWYRSQTTARSGWLPVCCDDGSTYSNYDGWAGMYGEPLDRLQLCITGSQPF